MQIEEIQKALREEQLDGWLFFDHHQRDPLAYRVLGLSPGTATRRWYYLIPASGEPKGLVHAEWKDHNDGYVGLPSGPGLGVEVDEKELERLSKVPSEWKWPVYGRLKDGSIADY